MSTTISILLVEDEESDILIIQRALRRCRRFTVLLNVAQNGDVLAEKLKCSDALLPQLILLDYNLPRVTGVDILNTLKGDPRTQLIPVIVLTTSERPSEIQLAYAAGANAFLVKPIHFADFVELMESLLQFWANLVRLPQIEGPVCDP